MKVFAERLKELRIELNLSQSQLSKQTKIDQTTISKWESDIQSPNAEYLVVLADFFNCSTDFLLGRVDQ